MTKASLESSDAVQERWGKEDFQKKLEGAFWMNHDVVGAHLNRLATGIPNCDWLTWFIHEFVPVEKQLSVLVLGCGEGWLERSIANLPWIRTIDAFDIAEGAVERATQRAQADGIGNIDYATLNLDSEELPPAKYDVVIAHSVLHHIRGLEHAFATIRRSLKPGARIAINEFVGPPHLQYRDEAMEIMNEILCALPHRLRTTTTTGELLEGKERPSLEYMLEIDPSEGVRADELDDFIRANLQVVYETPMGGTFLQHLLWEIVGNFRDEDSIDKCLLEWICLLEESLVQSGSIPSDYHFYICDRIEDDTGALPKRLAMDRPNLAHEVPEVVPCWRTKLEVRQHLHSFATGDPNCDWLTGIMAELQAIGIGRSSSVLWLGGEDWMLDVLKQRFQEVVPYKTALLVSRFRAFDAAFGTDTGLFRSDRQRRLAALGLLMSPEGAFVSIEKWNDDSRKRTLIERFCRPLSAALNMEKLPTERTSTADVALRDFFQVERCDELGGDLLEPTLDLYWSTLPEDRKEDVLKLLMVVEANLLRREALGSDRRGVLAVGPRHRRLLSGLLWPLQGR